MAKWSVDVYFTTYKTIEIEADSYLEARKGTWNNGKP